MTDLGANSWATGINSSGQVVGYTGDMYGDAGTQAFLWSNGQKTNLGIPSGYVSSLGYGLNDNGNVVGWGQLANYVPGRGEGIAYIGGQWYDLGGYTSNGISPGNAYAVNNSGTIVGESFVLAGGPGGTLTNPAPAANQYGGAYAINNSGVVVGGGTIPDKPSAAGGNGSYLWFSESGQTYKVDASDVSAGYGGGFFAVSNDGLTMAGMVGTNLGAIPAVYSDESGVWTWTNLRQTRAPAYQSFTARRAAPGITGNISGMDCAAAIAANGDIVGALGLRARSTSMAPPSPRTASTPTGAITPTPSTPSFSPAA